MFFLQTSDNNVIRAQFANDGSTGGRWQSITVIRFLEEVWKFQTGKLSFLRSAEFKTKLSAFKIVKINLQQKIKIGVRSSDEHRCQRFIGKSSTKSSKMNFGSKISRQSSFAGILSFHCLKVYLFSVF